MIDKVITILLTCNQKEETLACLKSLHQSQYPENTIIVVDNGSEDGTEERVKTSFPDVNYLKNETNLGASTGRNRGLTFALENFSFDYVLFMDNDIIVTEQFLTHLVAELKNVKDKKIEIASPKILYQSDNTIIDIAGGARVNFYSGSTQTRGNGEIDNGQYDADVITSLIPTTMVFMTKAAIERAKGYDPLFDPYGYEDLDMIIRANIPGTPFLYVPTSIIYHKGNRTGFSGFSKDYAKAKMRNLKLFLKRHSKPHHRVVFYTILPFIAARSIFKQLITGNFSGVLGLIKGYMQR